MSKSIKLFIFIICYSLISPAYADHFDKEKYTVTMPGIAKINVFSDATKAVGFVDESQDSIETDSLGLMVTSPKTFFKDSGGFSRLVAGSYSPTSWQLTTERPLGIAVTYNTSGYIEAGFTSLTGFDADHLSIYPATVAFGVGGGAGVKGHIFKFYPMVKVSKDVVPDIYTGVINFQLTVTSL